MDNVERLRGRGKALARLRGHHVSRPMDPDRLERILAGKLVRPVRTASTKDVQALVGKAASRMKARD